MNIPVRVRLRREDEAALRLGTPDLCLGWEWRDEGDLRYYLLRRDGQQTWHNGRNLQTYDTFTLLYRMRYLPDELRLRSTHVWWKNGQVWSVVGRPPQ